MRIKICTIRIITAMFLGLAGCRSVTAPRTPQIRTVASIGDRPQSATAGEPGAQQATEPEAAPVVAEEEREIRGRVVNASGEPVPNAKVRIAINGATAGKVVRTSTDESGRFTLHDLRPDSDYTLIAEDETGSASGRAEAATNDQQVRITLKASGRIKRASDFDEAAPKGEEPASDDPYGPDYPAPPKSPRQSSSTGNVSRDRAASRASAGKAVAWRGDGKPESPPRDRPEAVETRSDREEPAAEPAIEQPRELPRAPVESPIGADRDDLPGPKVSQTPKIEPQAPEPVPTPGPGDPEPEPSPITSPPKPETPAPIEPKPEARPEPPVESPAQAEPRPVEALPAAPNVPAASPPETTPTPEPTSAPIEAPAAIPDPPPAAEPSPVRPEPSKPADSTPETLPAPPSPAGEAEAPPVASPPSIKEPEPAVEAPPAATQVSANPGMKRPTWGDLSPKKPPMLAMNNAPSGRRRLLGSSRGFEAKAASPGDAAAAALLAPDCQFDVKTQRLVNFRLPDLKGNPVELKEIDADYILLDFWGSWCGPCLESIPHLVQLQEKYGDRLKIVGVAYPGDDGGGPDEAKKVEAVAKKLGINYTLLLGSADGRPCPLQAALHVQSFPTMVLIDRQGRRVWRESGASARALSSLDRIVAARTGSNVVRR